MTLFKDRALTIAILISALWHFIFIFSIKPVLPAGRIMERNTSIAFLGDILESIGGYRAEDSSAYTSEPSLKKLSSPGLYRPRNQVNFAKQILLENEMGKLEPNPSSFINKQPEKKDFPCSLGDNSLLELNIYRKKETARVDFSDFFIKGNARGRVIIYKPDLDKVTTLLSDFNSDFSANIKFKISKDGFVRYAECITSSGFLEIDHAAMRYIKKWQFVPDSRDDQEGVVRVSFK